MDENLKVFLSFRGQGHEEVVKLLQKHLISSNEKNILISFCVNAYNSAENYFKSEDLPLKSLKKIDDFDVIMRAWIFLNILELDSFLTDCKTTEELKSILDVSEEKLVKDFGVMFGGKDIDSYISSSLRLLRELKSDSPTLEDYWHSQLVIFMSIIDERIAGEVISKPKGKKATMDLVQRINTENLIKRISILF